MPTINGAPVAQSVYYWELNAPAGGSHTVAIEMNHRRISAHAAVSLLLPSATNVVAAGGGFVARPFNAIIGFAGIRDRGVYRELPSLPPRITGSDVTILDIRLVVLWCRMRGTVTITFWE